LSASIIKVSPTFDIILFLLYYIDMSSISTTPEAPSPQSITQEALDHLADAAGLSEETRDAVDQTITAVLQGLSLAADSVVHKRESPEENTEAAAPTIPEDPMAVYVLACLSERLHRDGQTIEVSP
jgi:hypothetical protein